MSNLTLRSFAALMQPVADFIVSINWSNGQPVDVLLEEKALRYFGNSWYYDHPIWYLFDELDSWGVTYGFASVENNNG